MNTVSQLDLKKYAHLISMEYIYNHWLYHPNFPGALNRAEGMLRSELILSCENNDLNQVWEIEKKLREHARQNNIPAPAAAEVEAACAVIEFKNCRFDQAANRLKAALGGFLPHGHFVAATRWMLGIVQWHSRNLEWEAFHTWTQCHGDFKSLTEDHSLDDSVRHWYLARRDEISEYLDAVESFLGSAVQASPTVGASAASVTPGAQVSHKQPANDTATEDQPETELPIPLEDFIPADYLRLFSIVGEIPAGDPGPIGFQDIEEDEVLVDRVMVGDDYYQIHNIKSKDHRVNLIARFPVVLKIRGRSMDKLELFPGDYVIVNRDQQPLSGDVVCAHIENVELDEQETLKKYVRIGNNNVLRAESNDPKYENWPNMPDQDMQFAVRGVVVARLVKVKH